MAGGCARGDYDQLHHFVAAGVWDAAPLETELLISGSAFVGGSDAVLVIDDTAVRRRDDSIGALRNTLRAKPRPPTAGLWCH